MRKKAVLSIRPKAIEDIEVSFNYFAENAGVLVAQRFFDEVKNQTEALLQHPESGAVIDLDISGHEISIRHKVLKRFDYLIYYSITETSDSLTIDIIRVLHAAQDRGRILQNES